MHARRTLPELLHAPLAILVAAALLAPARAEDERDPLLGAALVVGEQPLPDEHVQRELVLGPGRAVLERAIDGWTVESELLQRAQQRALERVGSTDADGYDQAFAEALAAERAAVEPDEAQLAAARTRTVQALGVETEEELAVVLLWRFGGEAGLSAELVNGQRFDNTFLPDDPGLWPEITLGAFEATPAGARELERARRGWAASERARLHGLDSSGTLAQRAYQRDVVRGALRAWMGLAIDGGADATGAAVATADLDGDGEPDAALTIGELWPVVRGLVTPEDVELAKRWVVTERLVRARLAADGASVPAPGEVPAPTTPDGFPIEASARFQALREAFVAAHGARVLADEKLAARARHAAGNARVHAEVMHFATVDLSRRVWLAGERERARARAAEILSRLRVVEDAWRQREPYQGAPANPGTLWRAELTANGDLAQPAQRGRRDSVPPHVLRGVLGAHTHAQLCEALGEDARWRFVHDDSLADRIFTIEPGSFGGPLDGRLGVALVRGTAFQEAREPPSEALVRAWVLERAFERYAREARAAASIAGFD